MNINSNELLLINKKSLKFGEGEKPVETNTTALTNTPVSNPEETIKALELKGKNNIAFQAAPLKGAKSLALKTMMALAMLTVTVGATSCKEDIYQNVDVDFKAITDLYNQMMSFMQEMLNETKKQNEEMKAYIQESINWLKSIYDATVQNGKTLEEFKEEVCLNFKENKAMQETILNAIVTNGGTMEEANKTLDKIFELISSKKYEEAMKLILDALNGINSTLSSIKSILESMEAKLDILVEQGVVNELKADEMIKMVKEFYEAYQNGQISANEFYEKAAKYMANDELLQKLIYEQSIKNGLSIEEANEAVEKGLAEIQKLLAEAKYEEALAKIISILGNIDGKLDVIINKLEKLQTSVNKLVQQGVVSQAQADEMNAKLSKLIKEVQAGNINEAEFFKQASKYMMQDMKFSEIIIKQLVKIGISQEKTQKAVESLDKKYQKGEYEEAFNTVIELLENIDSKVSEAIVATLITNDKLDVLAENDKISQAQANEIKKEIIALKDEVKKGNITQEEFYKNAVSYMMGDSALQALLLKQTSDNGTKLDEIKALMNSGKYEEALDKINAALDNISGQLSQVITLLKEAIDNMNKNHEEYMAAKDKELDLLAGIYINSELELKELSELKATQKDMATDLGELKTNVASFKEYLADDTKFNTLIQTIKDNGLSQEDFNKFEQMFKLLNMNLTDVANMTKAEVVAAIEKFEKTYIATEEKEVSQFNEMNNKLDIIVTWPGLDTKGLEDAIKQLIDASKNNTTGLSTQLNGILEQLKIIETKLNAMFNQFGEFANNVSVSNKLFMEKWDATLAKLDTFASDLAGLKNQQAISNAYLKSLVEKGNQLIKVGEEILATGNGGMTQAQFEESLAKRDAEAFKQYKALLADLGLDKIAGDVATLKDLVANIKNALDNKANYAQQLTRIISLLEGINWNTAENAGKLDQIKQLIAEFKCNCQCGNDSSSNEGILGDIENLLGA